MVAPCGSNRRGRRATASSGDKESGRDEGSGIVGAPSRVALGLSRRRMVGGACGLYADGRGARLRPRRRIDRRDNRRRRQSLRGRGETRLTVERGDVQSAWWGQDLVLHFQAHGKPRLFRRGGSRPAGGGDRVRSGGLRQTNPALWRRRRPDHRDRRRSHADPRARNSASSSKYSATSAASTPPQAPAATKDPAPTVSARAVGAGGANGSGPLPSAKLQSRLPMIGGAATARPSPQRATAPNRRPPTAPGGRTFRGWPP